MLEFNKRALNLKGSRELFSDDDFVNDANAVEHQNKKSRNKATVGASTSLFAQINHAVPLFATAELAHVNAQQPHSLVEITTVIHAANSTPTPLPTHKRNQATFFGQSELLISNAKKTLEVIMPLTLNPQLRFSDGSIPVSYKENNPVVLKIMKKREEILNPVEGSVIDEHKCLPINSTYTGLKLVSRPGNQWVIHDGLTNSYMNPEAGAVYAFVTMPDKSIRIMPSIQRAHLLSSNMSPVVRYAGNVVFNSQNEIASWDNISGAYKPSADLAHQAGFHQNDLCKFKKYCADGIAADISTTVSPSESMTRRIGR